MEGIALAPGQRLLVLAPHPDDETLACGGLIVQALAAGAEVRVVFATDGDDNPWPQRLAERHWRIDAVARARWGARRRAEARAALALLGIDPDTAVFLGWPDQGMTTRLLRDGDAMVDALTALLAAAPQVVAVPSAADTHPDHSTLRLLLGAALQRARSRPRVLEYLVHGDARAAGSVLTLTSAQVAIKRAAALTHASQTLFGKRRLLRFIGEVECFDLARCMPPVPNLWQWRFDVPLLMRPRGWRGLLVGWTAAGRLRTATLRLPWPAGRAEVVDVHGEVIGVADVRRIADGIELRLAPLWNDVVEIHAKAERDPRGWLVFDRTGWCTPAAAEAGSGALAREESR